MDKKDNMDNMDSGEKADGEDGGEDDDTIKNLKVTKGVRRRLRSFKAPAGMTYSEAIHYLLDEVEEDEKEHPVTEEA